MMHLFTTFLEISITVSAVVLLLKIAKPLLSRFYSAKLRYWIWLFVAVRLLIPFHFAYLPHPIPSPISSVPLEWSNNPVTAGPAALPPQTTVLASAPSFSIWNYAMAVWMVGCVVFLLYHLVGYYTFRKQIIRWSKPAPSNIQGVVDEYAARNLKKPLPAVVSKNAHCPMMIGFIRPVIVFPATEHSDKDIRFIIRHELTHYERRDIWYKLLLIVANALHWFNPFVYLLAREANSDMEISCDDEVLQACDADGRKAYGETIIASISKQKVRCARLTTYFYPSSRNMKERFQNIMSMENKRKGVHILVIAVIMVAAISGTSLFAANAAAESNGDNTPTTYVETSDNQSTPDVKREPLPEYESFGISYDSDRKMLFNGQVVRYFWDGYEIEPGLGATHYDYLNEAGTVDVHTVRSAIDNGDGSVDPFGELQNIVAYTQEEFDARDIDWIKGTGRGPVSTTVDGSGSAATGGKTFEDIFAGYEQYGIGFTTINGRGGAGNVTYQGQAVKTFIDEKDNGGVFMYQSIDGGDITVRTVYDASGNLTGVKVDS